MKITAIIFDAFGTTVQITRPTHPYRQLLREGRSQGRVPKVDDLRTLMTNELSLGEAACVFGIKVTPARLHLLEQALEEEVASMRPYPDAREAIAILQAAGLNVAICSNLAEPYGMAIKQILPALDAYVFSYQAGVTKPDPIIYRETCSLLGVQPGNEFSGQGRVVMIGDSPRCDRDGPREVGISGFLLGRGRPDGFSSLVGFAHTIIDANSRAGGEDPGHVCP
ncbi:haloacid dehalogenase [Pseudomonas syringae]|uniref:HAD family hydrolase n=1 Tax=Pseudomonas syringae TaxID=317 RepID=UPI000C1CBAA5|nr:HAD family hydrolase [Pseudomonas syringae]PIO94362.1 haloacid dehalogenase [Pseudomonas syringae]